MTQNKSYRIRTKVGEEPGVINVHLDQSYDLFEILSLKLTQEDAYKLYTSSYGVIVGRIIAMVDLVFLMLKFLYLLK